jgi:hypothetical protein
MILHHAIFLHDSESAGLPVHLKNLGRSVESFDLSRIQIVADESPVKYQPEVFVMSATQQWRKLNVAQVLNGLAICDDGRCHLCNKVRSHTLNACKPHDGSLLWCNQTTCVRKVRVECVFNFSFESIRRDDAALSLLKQQREKQKRWYAEHRLYS